MREALDQTATAGLRRIAAAHNLPHDDAATRAELIEAIEARLLDPSFVQDLLARLDDNERQALLAIRASGGEIRGFLLDRDTPGAGDVLSETGLLYRTFTTAGPRRGEVFSVPDELLELLPQPPADEAPPRPGRAPPPAERRASEPAFSVFALASTLGRPAADLQTEVSGWSACCPTRRRWPSACGAHT